MLSYFMGCKILAAWNHGQCGKSCQEFGKVILLVMRIIQELGAVYILAD
jgi:hypothetical protein